MFRQLQSAVVQHLRAVNDRMHQNIMSLGQMSDIVPPEHFLFRKALLTHDLLVLAAFLLIHIIGEEHIRQCIQLDQCPQALEHAQIAIAIQPVIAVDHLKIDTRGVFQAGIDCRAMAAVWLMNCANDARIPFCIRVCNFRRSI